MNVLWLQLQSTDSHLDDSEQEAAGQRGHLNKLTRELGELNRTVSHLHSQLGNVTGASFNGKTCGVQCPFKRGTQENAPCLS